jgi:aminopeptidase N
MRPGASLDLSFDLALARNGPKGDGEDHDLVANGSYLHGMALVPSFGYRRSRELVDEEERRRQGLPPRGEEEAELDVPADAGRMTFDVTVVTPADQLAVAPGVLVSSEAAAGRRRVRFRAERPVTAFFSVAAARYAVARTRHGGIDVEVYHHPGHTRNVARVLEAATAALEHCVSRYGPYPLPQLRIAEVPAASLGAGGFALPGVVYLSEDRGFLIDAEAPGRIDLLAKRVAHEVSHQWWGHQLAPAPGPGAAALVETLARHTELRVLAALRGPEALPPVLDRERDRYLQGRTGGDEVPLAEVRHQAYLFYAKGALAMADLVALAGEDAVDGALRGLLEASRSSGRAPTARDLLDVLLRATPPEHRPRVEEWWTRTGLPEDRVTRGPGGAQGSSR